MPDPTSATLTGPSSGECSIVSTQFTVTLDQPAAAGGVRVTIGDTDGGDTVTTSPFTISAGSTTGRFTITPATCGSRDISITTDPVLTILGSPITYDSLCACPDDAGGTNQSQTWTDGVLVCPAAFSVEVRTTPTTLEAKSFYCTLGPLSMTITE